MTNLFTNLSKNVLCTVNGPIMDRHNIENGPIHSRQLFAVLVMMLWVKLVKLVNFAMQIFKWTKWTKWTEQIFVESAESAESAKSARSIFATFATFASANFVGKASCESTVRYRERSRISLIKPLLNPYLTLTRFRLSLGSNLSRFSLASLICLCMLTVGVGEVWGAEGDKAYTLDFTAKTANHTAYSDTWTYGDFSIFAGANNSYKDGWLWVRFGGKGGSKTTDVSTINSTITSTRAITDKVIKKVTVYYTKVTNDNYTANKCTLEVASNSTFTSIVDTRIIDSPVKSAGSTFDFTPNTVTVWPASAYYRITIGATITGKKNTGVDVTKIEFIEGSSGSVAVTGVSVSPTTKSIVPGETFTITPTVSPAGATNKSVSWTSSATSYATVNSSGVVTGVAAGSSTITCTTTDGSYNATCTVTVRGVTLQARDEDGNAIAAGGPGAPTRSGTTITAAANSGNYVFKQWDVVNATAASSTTSPTTISNPTGAVTVTAVYYKPITITYKANGSIFTTQTYARGGTLAFPASNPDGATYSCTGKTFVGWVGEANKDYSHASTPPTYATAGGSVTAAATYYAVFADASSGGGYEQVTSLSSIHEGSAYFAYYGSYSGSRWYGVNAINTVVAPVDVSEGELTTSKTGDGAYTLQEFTLVAVDASNYEYYIKIGNKYVTASGDKTDLSVGNDAYLWKFNSINSTNYNLEILHDASTDYYIKVGVGSATGGKFRSYTSSGQQVSLFQSSTTYSNYATNCCTPLGSINGSFFWTPLFEPLSLDYS